MIVKAEAWIYILASFFRNKIFSYNEVVNLNFIKKEEDTICI